MRTQAVHGARFSADILEEPAAVLAERARLSRELHDAVAQDLAHIVAQVRRWQGGAPAPDVLAQIGAVAPRALEELRRTMLGLRIVPGQPVEDLLRSAATQALRGSAAQVAVQTDVEVLPLQVCEALHRIVGEATSNALRHGLATRVAIVMQHHDGGLRLQVTDNGRGLSAEATDGLGISGMRERARSLAGTLRVDDHRPGGTIVELIVP